MNTKINIYWLTCSACELLIENKLNEIKWIKVIEVNHKKWYLNIDYNDEKMLLKAKNEIKKLWYNLEKPHKIEKNSFLDYFTMFLFTFILMLIYFLFKDSWLYKSLDYSQMNYFIIFLIWIVASLSSCLAITWGLIIGFSNYVEDDNSFKSKALIQAKFHIWRLFFFFILGWILGLFWWFLGEIFIFNKILLLIAWLVMLYMWLSMSNLLPKWLKLWIKLPSKFTKKIYKLKDPKYAFFIWWLSFFLPCWFTQSIQVLASSSGWFMSWAFMMLAFALWTFPVLFLVWLWNTYFKDKSFPIFSKLIWVLVIFFSIIVLSWFFNFINLNKFIALNNTQISNQNLEEIKKITATHNWVWVFPEFIELSWAKKYEVTIIPESDWLGCFYSMTIPGIDNTEHLIKKWVPIVINIENKKTWRYKIVCGSMWMYMWNIIIK